MIQMTDISIQEQAGIYAFLKMVFATEPSSALLAYLQTPAVLESFKVAGVCIEKKELDVSELSKLQADYTQLFIGPKKHIALNEAIYIEQTPQFWGEATVQLNKLIKYLGLELDEHWTRMPDHIAIEFELMQKLLEAKIKAVDSNDQSSVEQCTKAINNLFKDHIIKWVPQVCTQVIDRAQTNTYKAIGTWTKMFIEFSQEIHKNFT